MNDHIDNSSRRSSVFFILLIIFATLFLTIGIGEVALIDWDENIYAEASRQMLLRGDYLNVYINNQLFSEKPPFFFWEQVISYKIFGVGEFAARFPSAVAGVFMVALLYFVGCKFDSPKFGLIWGLIYSTSFLPSVFGRAGVIDHTFNLFIACGAYFLFLFDLSLAKYLASDETGSNDKPSKTKYLVYLTLGSVFMGIACLTKGPLGGVIPLVAFIGYKTFNWQYGLKLVHFLYCGFVSLSIALSWYLLNWIITGESFLEGFIRFQLSLFSKTLEGHEGPFFYHFVVALIGLVPWTPFLFIIKPRVAVSENPLFRKLLPFTLAWIGFVLFLFSMVSTKLPHYSASFYIPFSFLISCNLLFFVKKGTPLPKLAVWAFLVVGVLWSVFLVTIPQFLRKFAEVQEVSLSPETPALLIIAGLIMTGLFFLSLYFFNKQKIVKGLVFPAIAMFLFTQSLWVFHVPDFLKIHQEPLLVLVEKVQKGDQRLALYRMVSFAAFFYGRGPIDILHNYKFEGNPEILKGLSDEVLYVITDKSNKSRLLEEAPRAEFEEQQGRFLLFRIPKTSKS